MSAALSVYLIRVKELIVQANTRFDARQITSQLQMI